MEIHLALIASSFQIWNTVPFGSEDLDRQHQRERERMSFACVHVLSGGKSRDTWFSLKDSVTLPIKMTTVVKKGTAMHSCCNLAELMLDLGCPLHHWVFSGRAV